ncbi:hypothetical protein IAD21_01490 [Abditibacteriota bacterium]|nr:hypothetical protein IAD21_01490 [Abditibacteriota bacterium]
MKHLFLSALCAVAISTAVAAPKTPAKPVPAKTAKKAALKVLHYCPTSGEKLPSKAIGTTTYKGYKIAFCCPGCPEEFASLSPKEKDAKIAKIVAKQAKEEKGKA